MCSASELRSTGFVPFMRARRREIACAEVQFSSFHETVKNCTALFNTLFSGGKKKAHTHAKRAPRTHRQTHKTVLFMRSFFFFLTELASLLSIALFRSLRRRVVGASHFFLDSRQSLLVLERGKRVAYDGR